MLMKYFDLNKIWKVTENPTGQQNHLVKWGECSAIQFGQHPSVHPL